nr:hypothetical protein [Mycolicibacterium vanbaalenii]
MLSTTVPFCAWVYWPTVSTSPALGSVSLPSTAMVVGAPSDVDATSPTAVGEELKKVRWISRRANASTAQISGGSAGLVGPGLKIGASSMPTTFVAMLMIAPGAPNTTPSGVSGCRTNGAGAGAGSDGVRVVMVIRSAGAISSSAADVVVRVEGFSSATLSTVDSTDTAAA